MLWRRIGVVLIALLGASVVQGVPLEALRSLVFLSARSSSSSHCVGVQLVDGRVITSAACDTHSLDTVALVEETSFVGGGNGLTQLARQPPQALARNATVDEAELPGLETRNGAVRVLRLRGISAPSSLVLPPNSYVIQGEDPTASILEVDPTTLFVHVTDQLIFADQQRCQATSPESPSICVLPFDPVDRASSPLSHPWRFLVKRSATGTTHFLLGVGLPLGEEQEAKGLRLFAPVRATASPLASPPASSSPDGEARMMMRMMMMWCIGYHTTY